MRKHILLFTAVLFVAVGLRLPAWADEAEEYRLVVGPYILTSERELSEDEDYRYSEDGARLELLTAETVTLANRDAETPSAVAVETAGELWLAGVNIDLEGTALTIHGGALVLAPESENFVSGTLRSVYGSGDLEIRGEGALTAMALADGIVAEGALRFAGGQTVVQDVENSDDGCYLRCGSGVSFSGAQTSVRMVGGLGEGDSICAIRGADAPTPAENAPEAPETTE